MPTDQPRDTKAEIDELWFADYFEHGLTDLINYLARWAAFAAWCVTHNREETPC